MHSSYREIKWTDEDIVNVGEWIPRGEYNPRNVRPWLLHDHGFVLAVVFASNLQDAIAEAADAGKLDRYMLSMDDPSHVEDHTEWVETDDIGDDGGPVRVRDWKEDVSFLGNASEPFDIESLGCVELPNPPMSWCAVFNARENVR